MGKHTDRRRIGRLLAATGLVLVAATGGVVLSGSAPAESLDREISAGVAPPVVSAPVSTSPPVAPSTRVTASSAAPSTRTSSSMTVTPPSASPEPEAAEAPTMPVVPPSPALRVSIPTIGVDATVLPVDSVPTGERNAWGGEVFAPIEFPVDADVRQWVRRGDPNSVPSAESATNVKAFDRTVLYGHASDIGNHLVFQDLSALRPGDEVTVETALGRFGYAVTTVMTRAKSDLDDMAELYEYPADGRKELALVACLPDTTNNVVVFAVLTAAQALSDSALPD